MKIVKLTLAKREVLKPTPPPKPVHVKPPPPQRDPTLKDFEEEKFDKTIGNAWTADRIREELQKIIDSKIKNHSARFLPFSKNTEQLFNEAWSSFPSGGRLIKTEERLNNMKDGQFRGIFTA